MAKITPQLVAKTFIKAKNEKTMVFDVARNRVLQLLKTGAAAELPHEEMQRDIKGIIEFADNDKPITRSVTEDVIFNLRLSLEQLDSEDEAGICFSDGFLNFETLFKAPSLEKTKLASLPTKLVPETYTTLAYPVSFADVKSQVDASAVKQRDTIWTRFLDEMIVDKLDKPDTELQAFLQEIAGYLIYPRIVTAAGFFFVGVGANGKSVVLDIFRKLVGGKTQYSAKTIESLTTSQFSTVALAGKRANFCAEEESKHIRSDKFKALCAGDEVEAERKFLDSVIFKNKARFVFASQKLPSLDSIDYGIMRRLKILPFNKKLPEEEWIPFYADKIIDEAFPEVVAWALTGLQRFMQNNGRFGKTIAVEEQLKEYESETSTAVEFVREYYIEDERGRKSIPELYREYSDWCLKNGRKPLGNRNFGRDLSRVLQYEVTSMRDTHGEAVRARRLIPRPPESVDDEPVIAPAVPLDPLAPSEQKTTELFAEM